MGMYTEVFFRAELDEYAYKIITKLENEGILGEGVKDSHPFFKTDRYTWMWRSSSYYFPGANHFVAEKEVATHETMYFLSFRANLKNYRGEIEKFFDWVTPHVKNRGERVFLGYSLYEEATVPTLYYTEGVDIDAL